MILRRPYAFLIKYFKLIHILMFLIFGYFVFVLRKIYVFFSDYVASGNFTYKDGMAFNYVPIYLFLLVVLILVGTIFIYFLMKRKEKPVLFYQGLIGYSSILLILFIYLFSFFSSLDRTIYEPLRIVVNRDIVLFVYIVNYFYVGFSFIRGFGFDIKKFSFDQDKKELNIEESDNEEFELNLEIDEDKVARNIRKEKREFRYYIKENSTFLTITSIVIVLGLLIYGYVHFFVINKIYHENDSVMVSNLVYQVNKSYVTRLDKYSNIVSPSYKFVLVDLNINNPKTSVNFNHEKFRIQIEDNYYYPVYNFSSSFNDLGKIYEQSTIKANTKDNYILIFKVPKDESGKIYFEILKNSNTFSYEKVLLETITDKKIVENYQVNDEFQINDKTLGITDYRFVNHTSFVYNECDENNKCMAFSKSVIPDSTSIVLVLNIKNSKEFSDDFFDNYVWFKYDNKEISSKDAKLLARNDDTLYFQVPKSAMNSFGYEVLIRLRNHDYQIVL